MEQRRSSPGRTRRNLLRTAAVGLCGIVGLSTKGLGTTNSREILQPVDAAPAAFVRRAFEMRDRAVESGDQGYGAVIVSADGEIVGQAPSRVVVHNDPTAHAEMEAIRDATRRLGTRDLSGHVLYSSSRPCPMCEAAAYWANVSAMIHGRSGRNAGRPSLCR